MCCFHGGQFRSHGSATHWSHIPRVAPNLRCEHFQRVRPRSFTVWIHHSQHQNSVLISSATALSYAAMNTSAPLSSMDSSPTGGVAAQSATLPSIPALDNTYGAILLSTFGGLMYVFMLCCRLVQPFIDVDEPFSGFMG